MNSFNGGPPEASRLARLELNARGYRPDKTLDAAADLIENDMTAWMKLPLVVQDRSSVHKDMRDHYRAFVAAGGPDDRAPSSEKETNSW